MGLSGTAIADHHQFVVGAQSAETYEPVETGSVMEVGSNFVTVMTGIAYGPVSLAVEVVDEPPPFDAGSSRWEVVEEATVKVTKALHVITLDGERFPDFDRIPITRGQHTFRVSARGRDAFAGLEVSEPNEEYLLQMWRVTQPHNMIRLHKVDGQFSQDIVAHPTRNWWDPDPAADATLHILYGYDQMAEWAKDEARRWGGRPPSEKLRSQFYAQELAFHDRALVDAITRAKPAKLSAIAAWAARRAYTIAGLADIEWVRSALDALDRGDPLEYPFREEDRAELSDAIRAEVYVEPTPDYIDRDYRAPVAMRVSTIIADAAKTQYALTSVFTCLRTAVHVDDGNYDSLVADLRKAFFPRLMSIDKYERWI